MTLKRTTATARCDGIPKIAYPANAIAAQDDATENTRYLVIRVIEAREP